MYLKALAPICANGIAAERGEMFSCSDPAFVTLLIQNNNAEFCLEPEELLSAQEANSPSDLRSTSAKSDLINAPPSLKSMFREDTNNVFMNLDELGEPHTVKSGNKGEEKTVTLIIDNDELMRRQSQKSIHDDGIFRAQVLLYCKGADFGSLPDANSIITLDGNKYRVYDAKDDEGIYVIILERYASRGGL